MRIRDWGGWGWLWVSFCSWLVAVVVSATLIPRREESYWSLGFAIVFPLFVGIFVLFYMPYANKRYYEGKKEGSVSPLAQSLPAAAPETASLAPASNLPATVR